MASDSMDMSLSKLWVVVKNREAWSGKAGKPGAVHGVSQSDTTEQLNNNSNNFGTC